MLQAILFDLDGTLYDSAQYYRGAFGDIATRLEQRCGREADTLAHGLEATWLRLTSSHPRLFNEFLRTADLPESWVPEVVAWFHEHQPQLELYEDARRALEQLRGQYSLALLTDGPGPTQRRKIAALEIESLFDVVMVTGEQDPSWRKPSPEPFRAVCEALNVHPRDAIYIGDNPRQDAPGPHSLGMPMVRFRRGEYARQVYEGSVLAGEVDDFEGFLQIIAEQSVLTTP